MDFCKTSLVGDPQRTEDKLTMSAAGLVCTDITRIGKQQGDAGKAYKSQSNWMWERHMEQDDLCHVECGPDWEPACFTESLGESHEIVSLQLCGTEVGDVNTRLRRHTFAFKKGKARHVVEP